MPHPEPSPSLGDERDSIAQDSPAERGNRLTAGWGIAIVALPAFLLMLGMGIERTRRQMTDLIPILILGVLVGAAGFYFALYEGRPRRSSTPGNRIIKDGEKAGNIKK
jgi:hypothetical protein